MPHVSNNRAHFHCSEYSPTTVRDLQLTACKISWVPASPFFKHIRTSGEGSDVLTSRLSSKPPPTIIISLLDGSLYSNSSDNKRARSPLIFRKTWKVAYEWGRWPISVLCTWSVLWDELLWFFAVVLFHLLNACSSDRLPWKFCNIDHQAVEFLPWKYRISHPKDFASFGLQIAMVIA